MSLFLVTNQSDALEGNAMRGRTRKTVAAGAATLILAGSAALAIPGMAAADTVQANCGDTVTVKPGDQVETPFGLKTVTDGLTSLTGGLLGGLCKVTVKVVDTVVAPVPGVGAPAAGAVNGTVGKVTGGVAAGVNDVAGTAPGRGSQPQPQRPGSGQGAPQQGPGQPSTHAAGNSIPAPNSPVLGSGSPAFGMLPTSFSTGYAPMRNYSSLPFVTAGLYTPSPGVRYGGQVPGYAPEFGILGPQEGSSQGSGARNAGDAQALPGSGGLGDGIGLPVLVAVLALSGVSAGLVRTWVLRKTVPA